MIRTLIKISLSAVLITSLNLSAQHQLVVDATSAVAKIQPTMYGIFFEDINFAADGGLYAEMVKNRSFEFTLPMMGWEEPGSDRHSLNVTSGRTTVINMGDKPNPHFVQVEVKNPEGYKLINTGFRGMGIKANAVYNLTVRAKDPKGISNVHFTLIDADGNTLGSTSITPSGEGWKEYTARFVASATEPKARLQITFEGSGTVDLDMISLFPQDTWKGRPKGLRKDLVQFLYDLNPGFLRFPGGCIVEGRTLARRYQWKKTVGPIEYREYLVNRWNTEFKHRPTPDYYQSFGLGFFEYFQLS